MDGRTCLSCKTWKSADNFQKIKRSSGKTALRSECKDCRSDRREPNSPGRLEQMRKAAFLRKYGLTWEKYQQMFIDRDGKCDICSNSETRRVKGKLMPLCVDHEDTLEEVVVRGLLCSNCNVAIGLLKHNPVLVKSAYRYLRRTSNGSQV